MAQTGEGKATNTPVLHAELLPVNLNLQRGPHACREECQCGGGCRGQKKGAKDGAHTKLT